MESHILKPVCWKLDLIMKRLKTVYFTKKTKHNRPILRYLFVFCSVPMQIWNPNFILKSTPIPNSILAFQIRSISILKPLCKSPFFPYFIWVASAPNSINLLSFFYLTSCSMQGRIQIEAMWGLSPHAFSHFFLIFFIIIIITKCFTSEARKLICSF